MDIRLYYKNFLTLLSGNTISHLVPFIVAPIISRIYSPDEMATFSNFVAIVSVLGIIASGRLELAIPIVEKKRKAQDLVFSGLIFTLSITLLSTLIPLFSSIVGDFYNDENLESYLWLVPFSVLVFGLLLIANNWVLRLKNYKIIAVGKIAQSIINNGLTVGIGFFKIGAIGMIIGWVASLFINILILSRKISRKIVRRKTDFKATLLKDTVVEFKEFPLINSAHAFMDVFATQFLLFWIITKTFGKWELGIYALMFKYIRGPISLITSSLSQVFYVETGNALNQNQPISHLFKRTLKITSVFALLFSIVLLLVGQKLFSWYFGAEWEAGGLYAQSILPILFFTFIISPVSGLTILFKKQFTGFLLSLGCYTFSLLALVVAVQLKWNFQEALMLYSAVFTIYYVVVFLWYRSLINKYEKTLNLTDDKI